MHHSLLVADGKDARHDEDAENDVSREENGKTTGVAALFSFLSTGEMAGGEWFLNQCDTQQIPSYPYPTKH